MPYQRRREGAPGTYAPYEVPVLPVSKLATTSGVTYSGGQALIDGTDTATFAISGLDETQGWAAMKIEWGFDTTGEPEGGAGTPFMFDWRDDSNTRISIRYLESGNSFSIVRLGGGGGGSITGVAVVPVIGETAIIVGKWNATTLGNSLNGANFVTGANTAIVAFTATTFTVGEAAGVGQLDSSFRWFAWGSGDLSNTHAATIGAFGDAPTPEDFAGMGLLGFWPADSDKYFVVS